MAHWLVAWPPVAHCPVACVHLAALREQGAEPSTALRQITEAIAREGGTPLVVAQDGRAHRLQRPGGLGPLLVHADDVPAPVAPVRTADLADAEREHRLGQRRLPPERGEAALAGHGAEQAGRGAGQELLDMSAASIRFWISGMATANSWMS